MFSCVLVTILKCAPANLSLHVSCCSKYTPVPAHSPGSASAATHPSLAVNTGSSVDRGGGGDEGTPPDLSNHSRSSSKKSSHSIHSVHNGEL